jgi:hypothetical protein
LDLATWTLTSKIVKALSIMTFPRADAVPGVAKVPRQLHCSDFSLFFIFVSLVDLYLSKGTITSGLPRFSLLRRKADCHTSLPTRSRQSGGTITSAVLPSTSSISDSQRTHHVQSWQYSKPFRLQSRVRTAIPAGLLEPQPSTPTV